MCTCRNTLLKQSSYSPSRHIQSKKAVVRFLGILNKNSSAERFSRRLLKTGKRMAFSSVRSRFSFYKLEQISKDILLPLVNALQTSCFYLYFAKTVDHLGPVEFKPIFTLPLAQ